MKLRTEVEAPKYPFSIGFNTSTLFVGSCFTENVGAIMRENKMPVLVNPFGVVYNPFSIDKSLQSLVENRKYSETDLQFRNGLWFSYDHHTRFSSVSREECLLRINNAVGEGHRFMLGLSNLVVTFGTARVYRLKSSGQVVVNCHKVPAKEFDHQLMSVDEIVAIWSNRIAELLAMNSALRIIFTVSPIRHWKDGAEGNQVSKSTLIVAVHTLVRMFPDNAFYFPSYEIMMDDLRDYRFYDTDMLHPSPMAIEYIWAKFAKSFIDKESEGLIAQIRKIVQAAGHRPFNPATVEHQRFIAQTLTQIAQIMENHSGINFDDEIEKLNSQLR
ncbi:MAG: GSCFA domain-containing protein [Bacteroidales bacterium]|nr:GSCFA domain-containing protein [Bacteroidales bacterium]